LNFRHLRIILVDFPSIIFFNILFVISPIPSNHPVEGHLFSGIACPSAADPFRFLSLLEGV
jgi:hypothetical protein